ncbi:MAG: hypothetical protein DMF59_10380 [Acidobacteria bacterium]|nr:MAG: hypothetical protein DMF59_10380 [Acidobacteriota bacterium]
MKKSIFIALVLTLACYRDKRPMQSSSAAPPPARSSAAAGAPSITLTSTDGKPVVEITPSGSDVIVSFNDNGSQQSLRGHVRENGKRKYAGSDGKVVVEVKPSEEGFKVRTADGKLLWKIKKSEDKVKISDNEENRNPYELKNKEGKIKVYAPADRLLGEVKYYGDKQRVEVKDAAGHELFRANALQVQPSFGVALLDRIPARERAIIMAELAAPLH